MDILIFIIIIVVGGFTALILFGAVLSHIWDHFKPDPEAEERKKEKLLKRNSIHSLANLKNLEL